MFKSEMIHRKQMKKSKVKEKQNIYHCESNGFLKIISRIKPSHSKRWHAISVKVLLSNSLIKSHTWNGNPHQKWRQMLSFGSLNN